MHIWSFCGFFSFFKYFSTIHFRENNMLTKIFRQLFNLFSFEVCYICPFKYLETGNPVPDDPQASDVVKCQNNNNELPKL